MNSNPIRISNLHLFEYSTQWYFAAKESTNMMLVVAATLPSPIWQQDNCTLQLSKYIISSPFSHESTQLTSALKLERGEKVQPAVAGAVSC